MMNETSKVGFLILMLAFTIISLIMVNVHNRKNTEHKITDKRLKIYNVLGCIGIICIIILLADKYLN